MEYLSWFFCCIGHHGSPNIQNTLSGTCSFDLMLMRALRVTSRCQGHAPPTHLHCLHHKHANSGAAAAAA